MLVREISKGENFSNRFWVNENQQNLFDYYNRFYNGFIKNKETLKSIINSLNSLKGYYEKDGPSPWLGISSRKPLGRFTSNWKIPSS